MTRLLDFSTARLAAFAALAAMALAGCGGGADTAQNPVTTGPSAGPTYVGPAPATADIQAFRINFWENVRGANRCGNCHNAGGQAPQFARSDDVNAAYQQASQVVNRDSPAQSAIVLKVQGGHNCWLADAGACASIMTRWITDWVGAAGTAGRQIQLTAPALRDPGSSRRFSGDPAADNFLGLYNLLDRYCSDCHQSDSATAQSPYFAAGGLPDTDPPSADAILEAYRASLSKINLDNPAESRFVVRLASESHNCWSVCSQNAAELQAAIQAMANTITVQPFNTSLVASKALGLYDGTVAAGGNRYEAALIALYEFKTGQGTTAFDTSGVDPAADLTFAGDVSWVGGWGINVRTGKAQATTTASRKLHQLITATGEYSIEAWVVPGNVVQEDARIVSYSGSTTARNFTMGQTMYNYDFFGRSTATSGNGAPQLSTADADERLQAALQHVVMTFDPVNGRRIYVNGEFTGDLDGAGGGTLGDWDNSFAFVLGNEVSGDRQWTGVIRLAAIHNRALTLQQIRQNFEAGVGEKFFLLFGVEHITAVPQSYILFEVSQYDSFSYLFTNPKFISLSATAMPGTIPIRGMRIGLNGAEPAVGQAYRLLDTTITDQNYSAATGQTLSTVGTVIGLERGPELDEFFLCFDQLGSRSNPCSAFAEHVNPTFTDLPESSQIGVRTFDAINQTFANITGVSPNNADVKETFTNVRQSLPAVSDFRAFLSSHQTSIAQLALQYCSVLIDDAGARASFFPGVNFGSNNLDAAGRLQIINPLIDKAIGNALSQPDGNDVRARLEVLTDELCGTAPNTCGGTRTLDVSKALCGAALGNAATLVQ
jgi:hypothetical protein